MRRRLFTSKKSDLKDIIECIPELEALAKAKGKKRIKLIAEAKSCIIKAISELAKNCIVGNVKLEDCEFDKLKKYQNILRKISTKSTSLKKKRQIISQNGGFLPLLIPPALSVVAGLVGDQLGKLIRKR